MSSWWRKNQLFCTSWSRAVLVNWWWLTVCLINQVRGFAHGIMDMRPSQFTRGDRLRALWLPSCCSSPVKIQARSPSQALIRGVGRKYHASIAEQ